MTSRTPETRTSVKPANDKPDRENGKDISIDVWDPDDAVADSLEADLAQLQKEMRSEAVENQSQYFSRFVARVGRQFQLTKRIQSMVLICGIEAE